MSNEEYEIISHEEYEALSETAKQNFVLLDENQIDEISNEKLRSYVKRAAKNVIKHGVVAGAKTVLTAVGQHAVPDSIDPRDNIDKMFKRTAYMQKAQAKLNKRKNTNEEYCEDIEESIASDTLKPGSRPDDNPKSKIEFMQRTLGVMNGMKKEDLSKFYNDVIAQIGKEADSLPAGASADANQGSIDMKTGKGPKTKDPMPKLSVKEDVEEMFDGQDLSEEFKDKASTLFEAAVTARISLEVAKLEEQFEESLEEAKTEITESLEKGLDTYLDYVVEKWMEDNQVAIESALRNEIMEEFIGGLKNLFAENYIEMPEEKINVVESLANKVEELEAALAESINENAELKDIVAESVRHDVLNGLAEGLTMTQAEKFFALAEGINFDGDLDVYAKKLSVVKEQYFSKKSPTTAVNIEEETFEGDIGIPQATVSTDPSVSKYVQAISRTIKK
jgi:DNA-binding FadR family transcriptional regulator